MTDFIKHLPLYETIRSYKKEYISKDLIAALTVAVVAIPQSMAYAIIAGVEPVYGLYTAIITVILGSLFGSSNHLVSGPTNAICLLIASSMKSYMGLENAYEMLFLLTFTVGAIQLIFGLLKLGKAVNYVSHPVIVGFSGGAGILIAMGQLNQLLGMSIPNSAQMATMEKIVYLATHLGQTNLYALAAGIVTIAIIIVCKKISKNIPGSLIGIIVPAIFIMLFALEKQGIKLTGDMPSSLPPFKMVQFNLDSFSKIFSGAVAIAIIGLVEAISISKSIASTSKQKIDANQEFIGQGLSNLVASFFQCFAGSGSFTRSAINYHSGAKTRLAAIFSGAMVALVLVFFAPLAKFIPMPCLAGVIIVIGYGMVNKKEIRKIMKAGKTDSIAMWVTFAATILLPELDWAIYLGIAISIILYLAGTNKVPVKILVPSDSDSSRFVEKDLTSIAEKQDVLNIQLAGNLYFGSVSDLETKLHALMDKANTFVLWMQRVVSIDATALDAIKNFIRDVKAAGGNVVICGVESSLNQVLHNCDVIAAVGAENAFITGNDIRASGVLARNRASALVKAKRA